MQTYTVEWRRGERGQVELPRLSLDLRPYVEHLQGFVPYSADTHNTPAKRIAYEHARALVEARAKLAAEFVAGELRFRLGQKGQAFRRGPRVYCAGPCRLWHFQAAITAAGFDWADFKQRALTWVYVHTEVGRVPPDESF